MKDTRRLIEMFYCKIKEEQKRKELKGVKYKNNVLQLYTQKNGKTGQKKHGSKSDAVERIKNKKYLILLINRHQFVKV